MGEESKKVAAAVVAVSDAEKLALLAEAEAALIGRGAITE